MIIPHIRWFIHRDLPEVLKIEDELFENPWPAELFHSHLQQRNCICMVATYEDQVVGYMVYELHKSSLLLLNFAVAHDFQEQGVGAAMIELLVGKLSATRRTRITVDVRDSNLEAQLFFRAKGFLAEKVLRNHYTDGDLPEDAYHFVYRVLVESSYVKETQ